MFHNITVFNVFLIKYTQPWLAQDTFKNILKSLTNQTKLTNQTFKQ